jgi:hypothetical protein
MNTSFLPTPPQRRLPDHVKLGIRSTIGDQVVATGEPSAADTTYTVCVGQVGQHTATSSVPILSVEWVISGGGPVANYAPTQASGILTPVTPPMLAHNPMTFAWSVGGPAVVGVNIHTAYGTGYTANNFQVTAPQVNFLEAMTGQVNVGPQNGGTFLSFGNPAAGIPGITINALTFGAQNVPGILGIIQLATNERFRTDTDDQPWHWSLNGQTVLDIGMTHTVFYQNQIAQLNPGANAQFDVTDAPALQLGPPCKLVAVGDGDPVVPETYNSVLMFQPGGGIWVPLSVLTWYWAGYSELENLANNIWSPPQQPENSFNPLGTATHIFPTWNSNTAAGQWVDYRGRPAS